MRELRRGAAWRGAVRWLDAAELEEACDTDALGMSGTAEDFVLDRQDIHDGGRPSPRPTLRKHKRGGDAVSDDIPPPKPPAESGTARARRGHCRPRRTCNAGRRADGA